MKKLYILITGLVIAGTTVVKAANPPVGPIKVNGSAGEDYYQNGFNKTSPTTAPTFLDAEEKDSVTVGSVAKYLTLPDLNLNKDWYVNGGLPDNNDISSKNASSLFYAKTVNGWGTTDGATNVPIRQIIWGSTNTGVDTLKMWESAVDTNTGAQCSDSVAIPVAVIAAPSITFNQVNGSFTHDTCCLIGTGITYTFPFTVNSAVAGNKKIKVSYTVSASPNTITPPAAQTDIDVTIDGSGIGGIPITFIEHGQYEVTFTRVSDRISRKSLTPLVGDLLEYDASATPNQSKTFVFNITKKAQPGPVYRIPNDY